MQKIYFKLNKRVVLFFIVLFSFVQLSFGQLDTLNKPQETINIQKNVPKPLKKIATNSNRINILQINVDSLKKDSIQKARIKDSALTDSLKWASQRNNFLKDSIQKDAYLKLYNNPLLGLQKEPLYRLMDEREVESKDELFYLILVVFFLIAIFRQSFPQYFNNIFRIFFQPSFRQLQTKDQMLQNAIPSLFFNFIFFVTASIYATFLLQYLNLSNYSFWKTNLFAIIGLFGLYFGKFILLQFSGWVFGIQRAMNTYIFIVFLLNKFLGVLLFPIIILIAFSSIQIQQIVFSFSFTFFIAIYIYRFFISYNPVKRDVKMNPLHFFIFVIAFEIAPMFLIYKLLMNFFN